MFPERFNNKTNGVTPRRWLRLANPALSRTISRAIGDDWITDLEVLRKLRPLAADRHFRGEFLEAKRAAKVQFADWLKTTSGVAVDPDTIFDCQVKRIHEYKRQLLNVLRVVVLYNRLRQHARARHGAADVLLRRQGCSGVPACKADHQAHQQRRRDDRRGSRGATGD